MFTRRTVSFQKMVNLETAQNANNGVLPLYHFFMNNGKLCAFTIVHGILLSNKFN